MTGAPLCAMTNKRIPVRDVCIASSAVVVDFGRCQWLVHGDSQYYYSENGRDYTYQEAQSRCAELGATLASVSTEQEHTFIVSRMTRSVPKPGSESTNLETAEKRPKYFYTCIACLNGILKHIT